MEKSKYLEKYKLNNNIEVPNRLVVAPLTLFSSNPDGSINDEERNYLKNRATGIGLYILGATAVSQEGIAFNGQPRALNEKDIPSLEERAKIIKSQGALAINQIHHGGARALKEFSGFDPLVPSSEIANKILKEADIFKTPTREITDEEIKKIINDFAYATELSLKSGYDGIEIHGANNYLIQQFYSPCTNLRNDDWGGSEEKRMKFPLQIVDACCKIREKYNRPDFIIGYRLSPEEPYETGLTMNNTINLIKNLILYPLQYIHISQWNYFTKAHRGNGEGIERLKTIHEITKGKVALIGVGGLLTEADLNSAFNTGFSEFIGVGIASILNKDFGKLLNENKGKQINLELDPEKKEEYSIPTNLWKIILQGQRWPIPIKGRPIKKRYY